MSARAERGTEQLFVVLETLDLAEREQQEAAIRDPESMWSRLGEILLERTDLTPDVLQSVVELQETGRRLGRARKLGEMLVDLGLLSKEDVRAALTLQATDEKTLERLLEMRPGASRSGQPVQAKKIAMLPVEVAGKIYGLPGDQVSFTSGPQTVSEVPGMAAHVCGVTRLRDRSLPVLDLGVRLGTLPVADPSTCCLVVIDTQELGGCTWAVAVDRLLPVAELDADSWNVLPANARAAEDPLTMALARLPGVEEQVPVLDLDQLFSMGSEPAGDKGTAS